LVVTVPEPADAARADSSSPERTGRRAQASTRPGSALAASSWHACFSSTTHPGWRTEHRLHRPAGSHRHQRL